MPLDKTRVEFDEDKIDRIVIDVRDKAHLNARRATSNRKLVNYEKKSVEQRYHNGERCWHWDGDL